VARRLTWSHRLFHASITALLLAGLLSAVAWRYERPDLIRLCNAAIVLAGSLAILARCWQGWLERAIGRTTEAVGPGHYPFGRLRDGRYAA